MSESVDLARIIISASHLKAYPRENCASILSGSGYLNDTVRREMIDSIEITRQDLQNIFDFLEKEEIEPRTERYTFASPEDFLGWYISDSSPLKTTENELLALTEHWLNNFDTLAKQSGSEDKLSVSDFVAIQNKNFYEQQSFLSQDIPVATEKKFTDLLSRAVTFYKNKEEPSYSYEAAGVDTLDLIKFTGDILNSDFIRRHQTNDPTLSRVQKFIQDELKKMGSNEHTFYTFVERIQDNLFILDANGNKDGKLSVLDLEGKEDSLIKDDETVVVQSGLGNCFLAGGLSVILNNRSLKEALERNIVDETANSITMKVGWHEGQKIEITVTKEELNALSEELGDEWKEYSNYLTYPSTMDMLRVLSIVWYKALTLNTTALTKADAEKFGDFMNKGGSAAKFLELVTGLRTEMSRLYSSSGSLYENPEEFLKTLEQNYSKGIFFIRPKYEPAEKVHYLSSSVQTNHAYRITEITSESFPTGKSIILEDTDKRTQIILPVEALEYLYDVDYLLGFDYVDDTEMP